MLLKVAGSRLNTFHRRLGTSHGSGSASGASSLNLLTWNRDKASHTELRAPKTWVARNMTLSCKHFIMSNLTRAITRSDFDVIEFKMCTTLSLSQLKRIFLFLRSVPQMNIATRMGNNSGTVISFVIPFWCHLSGHLAEHQ